MNQLVQDTVEEFIKDDKLFTSVDIANKIKEDGEWISNKVVSQEISSLFRNNCYNKYRVSSIKVKRAEDNVMVNAILYLPVNSNESDYLNTSAKPMTPDDFDFNHTVIDLDDDLNITIDTENKEEEEEMSDEDNKVVKKDPKKTFSKSKRNYKEFKFL